LITNWHRHLGIYGICEKEDKLLIIHKNGGPYTGRFDLPGGSLEPNESILRTITREFLEETGIQIRVVKHIGTKDFIVPWIRPNHTHTHCHHIAVLYEVKKISGETTDSRKIDDSLGAEWVRIEQLNEDNSSPLVMEAVYWMKNRQLKLQTKEYKEWTVKNV
jgi:ADP-ribose pyrophosphatase YjhB (NUDIX family)